MKKVISVFMLTAITAAPAFAAASSSHPPHPGHAPISGEAPGHSKGTMKYKEKHVNPAILKPSSPSGLDLQAVVDGNANARDQMDRYDGNGKDHGDSFEGKIINMVQNGEQGEMLAEIYNKAVSEISQITGIPEAKLRTLKRSDLPAPSPKADRMSHLKTTMPLAKAMNALKDCEEKKKKKPKTNCSAQETAAQAAHKSILDARRAHH